MSARSGLRVLGRGSLGVATLVALMRFIAPPSVPSPSLAVLVAAAVPATGAPVCPAAVRIAGHDVRPTATAAPAVTACPAPIPPPGHTLAVRPSHPVVTIPVTGPRPIPAPAAVLPVPIPPPLVLAPAVLSVPESYAAEHAPTSVLALGICSIVFASAALVLRLVRRGR